MGKDGRLRSATGIMEADIRCHEVGEMTGNGGKGRTALDIHDCQSLVPEPRPEETSGK